MTDSFRNSGVPDQLRGREYWDFGPIDVALGLCCNGDKCLPKALTLPTMSCESPFALSMIGLYLKRATNAGIEGDEK